jgi:hypothetical protein
LPIHFYFTDRFEHQCDLINGGWSYDLWQERQSESSNDQVFTIYKQQAPLTLPKNQTCRFIAYPYRLLVNDNKTEAANEPCQSDVAIVNYCRSFASEDEISVEFSDVLTDTLGQDNAMLAWVVLDRLRELIRTREPFARKPHLGNAAINRFDYLFYNQIRQRSVMQFVKSNPKLKIDVYGSDWQKILPAEACRGPIKNAEHLAQIYQGATLTVDFTKSLMQEQPHFTAIECLFAGGFPVCHALPAALRTTTSWLKTWLLPTIERSEDIPALLPAYRDLTLRQKLLSEAKTAFKTWHSRFSKPSAITPQSYEGLMDQIVLDDLANIGFGYVLYQLGYVADASSAWRKLSQGSGSASKAFQKRLQIAEQRSGQTKP